GAAGQRVRLCLDQKVALIGEAATLVTVDVGHVPQERELPSESRGVPFLPIEVGERLWGAHLAHFGGGLAELGPSLVRLHAKSGLFTSTSAVARVVAVQIGHIASSLRTRPDVRRPLRERSFM